jgi:hypothetical protein
VLETGDSPPDVVGFVPPQTGALVKTADPARPYALLDSEGVVVAPVAAFFDELQACSRPATTIRSYGMDLLRWWRFLAGWEVDWDRATRQHARAFARWMQIAPNLPQSTGAVGVPTRCRLRRQLGKRQAFRTQ